MTLSSLENYGHNFQIKVIASLLLNKEFIINTNEMVTDEFFSNTAHKLIVKEIIKYFSQYHSAPTMEVLKTEMKKVDNEVLKLSIKEQLRLVYEDSREDAQYIEGEFTNFCRNQQLKKALMDSVDLLKVNDYDSIRSIIDSAVKIGQDKNIGHEYNKDIEARFREDDRTVIPTPWPEINNIMQGGISYGDFGLIFGNPGGGKTHTLIAIGAEAVKLGFNVIHYTLELSEAYVGRRYDSCFSEISVNDVKEHREKVEVIVNSLRGGIIIKEYPPKRASIYTIENHIKKCQDLGFKPDLILIDYVDLLTTKKSFKERKDEVDDIYTGIKGLAKDLKLPIWSPSQVNRGGYDLDVITAMNSAGSFDKVMISDFCMSLSRRKEDKVAGTGRIHIMKNRFGGDGNTYSIKIDTAISKIQILGEFDENSDEPMQQKPFSSSKSFDKFDKAKLAGKFFELNM